MLDKVVFYNHFGAGDIFESREFVKDYMRFIPAKEYNYAHGKNPIILGDILLGHETVTEIMDPRKISILDNNILYINTWIGRDSRYVLPGIGCTVEYLRQMHNDQFQYMFGSRPFAKDPIDYIPDIDYTKFDISGVYNFCEHFKDKRKIYVSNGPVQSCQAENFDFNPILDTISNLYPDIIFILTQEMGLPEKENLFYTRNIINSSYTFDLNEASYLSTFCDIIIGRNSGPHVFAQVRKNWDNQTKKTLSFTYTEIGSTFVLTPMNMKKYWSPRTDYQGVVDKIKEIIDG